MGSCGKPFVPFEEYNMGDHEGNPITYWGGLAKGAKMSEVKRVRIVKCDYPRKWYSIFIGKIIKVKPETAFGNKVDGYYRSVELGGVLLASDCEAIEEEETRLMRLLRMASEKEWDDTVRMFLEKRGLISIKQKKWSVSDEDKEEMLDKLEKVVSLGLWTGDYGTDEYQRKLARFDNMFAQLE